MSTNSGSLGIKSLVESLGGRKYGYWLTLECNVTSSAASFAATSVTISGPTSSRIRGRRGLLADQGCERGGCGLWLSACTREAEVSFSRARVLGPQLLPAVLQRLQGRSSWVYRHCRSEWEYMEIRAPWLLILDNEHIYRCLRFRGGCFLYYMRIAMPKGITFWEVSFLGNLLYRETIREIGKELRVDGKWVDEVVCNRVLISAMRK